MAPGCAYTRWARQPSWSPCFSGSLFVAILLCAVKKSTKLPHRNRKRSSRHRAKLKAKHRRARLRRSRGERRYP